MTRLGTIAARTSWALGLLAAWPVLAAPAQILAAPAQQIEDVGELIRGQWYAIEIIVFDRTERAAETGPEDLVQLGGLSYPATLRAFANAQVPRAAELDPATRACLTFPLLQLAAAEQTTAAATPLEPARPARKARPPPAIDPVLAPHPLLDLLRAAARFQQDGYRWLDWERLVLKAEANRIQQARQLQLLWHGRWMQPVPARSAGEPLLLQAGAQYGSAHELEGTLQVTLGRYLHFQAKLWRQARVPVAQTPPAAKAQPPSVFRYVALEESRTMRSGELEYLDHPQFGILVRIDPVQPPPALAVALDVWKQFTAAQ